MGQIVSASAKPKRCNRQALETGGPLAEVVLQNGEYVLVSSDNTVSQSGNGIFDSYVVGDGTTLGKNLPVHNILDKTYDTSIFSGLGHQITPKNIQTISGVEKNVLTQEMINKPNTIYRIQYDFDLNGQTITVPNNCVVEFAGGSISNGTFVGNASIIIAYPNKIFNSNLTISGTWNINEAYPEWFGAVGDGLTDDTSAFQKLDGKTIKLLEKTYIVSNLVFGAGTSLIGTNINSSAIKQKDNSTGTLLLLKDWNGGIITNLSVVGGDGHIEKSTAFKFAGVVCSDALIKIVGTQYQGEGVGLTYYSSIKNICVYNAPCNGVVALARVTDEGVPLSYNWVFSIDGIWVMHSKYYGIALQSTSDNRFSNCYLHHSGFANLYDGGSSNIFENFKLDGISGDGLEHELIISGDEENSVSSLLNSTYCGALMICRAGLTQYRNFDLQSGAIVGLKMIGTSSAVQLVNSQFFGSINNCGISPNLNEKLRIQYCSGIFAKYIENCIIDVILFPHTSQKRDFIHGSGVKNNRIRLQNRRNNQDFVNYPQYSADIFDLSMNNEIIVPDINLGDKSVSGILHNLFENSKLTNHSAIYTNAVWDNSEPIFSEYENLKIDMSAGTTLYVSTPWGMGASKKGHLYLAAAICRVEQLSTKTPSTTQYFSYPYVSLNAMTSLQEQTTWNPTIAIRSGSGSLLSVGDLFMTAGVFKFDDENMPNDFIGQFLINTNATYDNGVYSVTNFVLYDLTEDLGIVTVLTTTERLLYNLMKDGGYWQLSQPLADIKTKMVNPTIQPALGAYLDKLSMQDFLQILGTAMGGGTWTAQFDSNIGKYVFDFRYLLSPTWINNKSVIAVGANMGNVAGSSTLAASEPINIQRHAGKVLTYTRPMLTSTTSESGMVFYDENEAAISAERVGLGQESDRYEVTQIQIPTNAVSVRFSTQVAMKAGFEVYVRPQ